MSDRQLPQIIGAGGRGGKGGGGGGEDPNSLRSKATVRFIDLLGEGEIMGLCNGEQSIFFDDTPLKNANGDVNFKGVTWAVREGLPDQQPIEGMDSTETEIGVGVQVKFGIPAVRNLSDPEFDAVKVTMRIPALSFMDDKGRLRATTVGYNILVKYNGGTFAIAKDETITGKCTSAYERQHYIKLPRGPNGEGAPWTIRIDRKSADSTEAKLQNDTFWHAMTGVIETKFTYPNSAIIGISADAELFGSNVPTRTYEVFGRIVRVPTNYDAYNRVYTGIWNGTFKWSWTNNPAWVLYDLLTNNRFGLGDHIDLTSVDKWALYEIAKYCDEGVPSGYKDANGNAILEPRLSFNGVIREKREAFEVVQSIATAFRGMAYWASGTVTVAQDRPKEPEILVTPSNVVDGTFSYQSSSLKARHTVAIVTWNDPANSYKPTPEFVEDLDGIIRYGYRPVETTAYGCTSRGQAHRLGKWILFTENHETQIVTYKSSLDHSFVRPGQLIAIQDPTIAGVEWGGRLLTLPDSERAFRRNEIRNSVMTGGAATTSPTHMSLGSTSSTGITRSLAFGTDTAGAWCDITFSGTTTNSYNAVLDFETTTQIATAPGEQWTWAVTLERRAGTLPSTQANLRMVPRSTTADLTSLSGALIGGSIGTTPTRFIQTATMPASAAFVRPRIVFGQYSTGVTLNFTVRIRMPQFERGTVATDFIASWPAAPDTQTVYLPSFNKVRLDQPVQLQAGRNYELNIRLPSGGVQARPVVNTGTTTDILTVTSAFTEEPQPAGLWLMSSDTLKPQLFTVITIREAEPHIYEVTGLQHEPGKFAYVDLDAAFDPLPISDRDKFSPPPPTDVTVVENHFVENSVARTDLTISWKPPTDGVGIVGYAVTADTPDRGTITIGRTAETSMDLRDAATGDYKIRVHSVNLSARLSRPVEVSFTATGWAGQPRPFVSNLELVGGSTATTFTGTGATFKWKNNWPAGVTAYPIRNRVKIIDPDTDVVLRDVYVTDTNFTYNFEDNVNDGGPRRRFKITVTAVNLTNEESAPVALTVQNPAPAEVSASIANDISAFYVNISPSGDADLKGYLIWASQTNGFTPSAGTLAYDGPDPVMRIRASDGTWYVRIAAYDVFGKSGLNISGQYQVNVTSILIDTVAPAIPAGLALSSSVMVSPTGDVSARAIATWNASQSTNARFYEVEVGVGTIASPPTVWNRRPVGDGLRAEFDGYPPGTNLVARVRAGNGSDIVSGWSSPLVEHTVALNTTPPANVTGLTAAAAGNTVFLNWVNPNNNDLREVEIWESTTSTAPGATGSAATVVARMGGRSTSYVREGLARGAQRWYWARAVNTSGVAATTYLAANPTNVTTGGLTNADLASDLVAPKRVSSLVDRQTNLAGYNAEPELVFNTTDRKLYRKATNFTAYPNGWQADVATTDLSGQVSNAQIADLAAAKLTGQVVAAQIADASISLSKFGTGLEPVAQGVSITNLLPRSEEFGHTAWTRGAATVTSNALAAPDGTTTADNLIETTDANAYHFTNQSITKAATSLPFTASVYVRNLGRHVNLSITGASSANGIIARFDPAAGTLVAGPNVFGTGFGSAAATITPVGGGWHRITVSGTSDTTTTLRSELALHNTTTNVYTGNGSSGVSLWGAQLEAGLAATPYVQTVAAAVTTQLPHPGTYTGPKVLLNSTDGKIYRLQGGAWTAAVPAVDVTGQLVGSQIQDAAITVSKFASGLTGVEIVGALPSVANFAGRTVYLTTDGQIYRHNGTSWTSAVPAASLTGQLLDAQLAGIAAGKITGQLGTSQIADDAIDAAKLAANAVDTAAIAAGAVTAQKLSVRKHFIV